MNNISELFFHQAETVPHKIAIIHEDCILDYMQLAENVRKRADFYRSKGLQNGDRVLLLVPPSIDFYEILLALFYIGCTAVVDDCVNRKRLRSVLQTTDCKAFIGIPKAFLMLIFSHELRRVPIKLLSLLKGKKNDIQGAGSEEIALISFTTGSTGIPKAAKRTHSFLFEQHRILTKEMNLPPDSIDYALLPIFPLNNLACGITTVIPSSFDRRHPGNADGIAVLSEIEYRKATTITAAPAFLEQMVSKMTPGRVSSLKKIFVGGAAIDPPFARRLQKAFPKCEIIAVYGSTEAEPIATLPLSDLAKCKDFHMGLPAGKPIDEISLVILPLHSKIQESYSLQEWDTIHVKNGEIGEICVAGPHVLKEYYHSPQAEYENKIHVGNTIFHRTGDSGRLDEFGMLYLCGRASTIFYNCTGELICPMIMESVIKEIPGIRVGTILRFDSDVVACLETELPEIDTARLLKNNAIPFDRIVRVHHIPRDPRHNSKLDYDAIRLMIS